jgi:hypothetical protein
LGIHEHPVKVGED